MKTIIKSSDLRHLSVTQSAQVIVDAYRAAPTVDSRKRIKELRSEIAKLEERFSMSTAEMLKRLCSGDLLETRQISSWKEKYMLLRAHQKNVRATA